MTELLEASPQAIQRAADFLLLGGVVALPTETVYGLAGWIDQPQAIERIFAAKARPHFDPLIVHVALPEHVEHAFDTWVRDGILSRTWDAELNRTTLLRLVEQAWPGPLTLLLPKGPRVSASITAGSARVALRVPAHPVFQAVLATLVDRLGRTAALAAPSANQFGRISPTAARHVWDELADKIPLILDGGACTVGVESTILEPLSVDRYRIRRPGGISREKLESLLHASVEIYSNSATSSGDPLATLQPGGLESHYAPRKPLRILSVPEWTAAFNLSPSGTGYVGFFGPVPGPSETSRVLSRSRQWSEVATGLYAALRELDADPRVKEIHCEPLPHEKSGIEAAIADRLTRASRRLNSSL